MRKIAPLSSSWMLTSILGFLISVVYVYPQSHPWGFTFTLVFAAMFVAALVSMTYGPIYEDILSKNRK